MEIAKINASIPFPASLQKITVRNFIEEVQEIDLADIEAKAGRVTISSVTN